MLKDYHSVRLSSITARITSLFYDSTNKYCLVGYENGQIMVWHLDVELVVEGAATQEDDVNNTKIMLTGHSRVGVGSWVVGVVPSKRVVCKHACCILRKV